MDLSNPPTLVLPHLHAMALALYFCPQATQALELGVGGGALKRYLGSVHPNIHMTSIESNNGVIQSCVDYFHLAPGNIIQGDGQIEIKHYHCLDLLFIDIFDGHKHPHFLKQDAFHRDCLDSLSQQGILAINLLPEHSGEIDDFQQLYLRLSGFRPLCFKVPGYQNRILLCAKQPLLLPEYATLVKFARRHHLNLNYLVSVH